MHDHVDADIRLGERPEDGGRDAGLVLDAADRDLGFVARIGDTANHMLFHDTVLIANECSGARAIGLVLVGRVRRFKTRTHLQRHFIDHGEFDRAGLQHLGAERGLLQHFLIGNAVELAGASDDPRIGGIDAVNIGVDIAGGIERRRHGHR